MVGAVNNTLSHWVDLNGTEDGMHHFVDLASEAEKALIPLRE